MFLVEINQRLGSDDGRLTDEAITDLIDKVVGELDQLAVEPSVSTCRVGDDIDMMIGVGVDDADESEALCHGGAIIGQTLVKVWSGRGCRVAWPPTSLRCFATV